MSAEELAREMAHKIVVAFDYRQGAHVALTPYAQELLNLRALLSEVVVAGPPLLTQAWGLTVDADPKRAGERIWCFYCEAETDRDKPIRHKEGCLEPRIREAIA